MIGCAKQLDLLPAIGQRTQRMLAHVHVPPSALRRICGGDASPVSPSVPRKLPTCARCGAAFRRKQPHQVYCSRECNVKAGRARRRKPPRHTVPHDRMLCVLRTVSTVYGVDAERLTAQGRDRTAAWARQAAYRICADLLRARVKEIGGLFGGRDHCTIRHGLLSAADRLISARPDHRAWAARYRQAEAACRDALTPQPKEAA